MPQRTPLYDWHVAHGARVIDFAGWEMPVQYSSIVNEHQAVRTAAGLFDISHMGRLVFSGKDALLLVQRIYTNDAAAMKRGQVRYGLVCNDQGGILDDVLVYRMEPDWPGWLMVVNASNREKIVAWINERRGNLDAQLRDLTGVWSMIAIQGPRAVDLVPAVLAGGAWRLPTDPPVEKLRYYFATIVLPQRQVKGSDDRLLVSRTGYTGEDGFEIMGPADIIRDQIIPELFETAKQQSIPFQPCGLGARDTLRLEAAMPLYGHELSEEIDPLGAGLDWAVKLEKGDFIGKGALLETKSNGVGQVRVGLELEGKRIAREGAAVLFDGKPVGKVTSGTFAPTVGKTIAMAYVGREFAAPGTSCTVDIRGKAEPARVVALPFYRRNKT
jgi:aminomethyltransferase